MTILARHIRRALILFGTFAVTSIAHGAEIKGGDDREPSEEEVSLQANVATLEKLVDAQPAVIRYRSNLAQCYRKLGESQQRESHFSAAATSYERAVALQQGLQTECSEIVEYQYLLSRDYWLLAIAQTSARRIDEAIKSLQRAVDVSQVIVENNPSMPEYARSLAALHGYLGTMQRDGQLLTQALESHKLAAELYEKLARTDFESRGQWPAALATYGDTLAVALDWKGAADAYGAAAKLNPHWRQLQSRRAMLQWAAGDAAGYQATCADLMRLWGKTTNYVDALWTTEALVVGENAVPDMNTVVALAQTAVAAQPGSALAKTFLGAAQLRAGKTAEAVATLKASIPRYALWTITSPQQTNQFRISRLFAEVCLADAYRQQGNDEALQEQIKKIADSIAVLEKPETAQDGETLPWSIEVTLELANRDLAALKQPRKSP